MISTIESSRANQRPTRVRFVVVGLVILLGMVTYLDRACIGTLEDPIMRDLKLSQHELSYAHTACRRLSMMFPLVSLQHLEHRADRGMACPVNQVASTRPL